MTLTELVETSRRVSDTRSRKTKTGLLADCLRGLSEAECAVGVACLAGLLRQGRIGLGGAAVREALTSSPVSVPTLTLSEVDDTFEAIAGLSGSGSAKARVAQLADLFGRATQTERDWLARLVYGELRQGAQESVLADAVAAATQIPVAVVRRAVMLAGDVVPVAVAALTHGPSALSQFRLQLLSPIQPMLAGSADDVDDALQRHGQMGLEYKLDGARVQVHKVDDEVRVFTRKLNDVTAAVPEIVEAMRQVPTNRLLLDGEAIVLRESGRPAAFQTTMRRFGRQLDVDAMRDELPLSSFFFDALHIDGDDLIDRPAAHRLAALRQHLPESLQIPHTVVDDAAEAQAFVDRALAAGHEGVMAKSLDAPYEAGRRGSGWLKLKPVYTLDLVVLAVEWGSGRRQGWLSNLHLGARDPATGGFVMLGKTFKGMTDEILRWQTERLQQLQIGREGHVVHVRPELVAEIAFDGVQNSPQYPGGVALRFARLKRYRNDKQAADADTIDAVRQIYASRQE